MTQCPFCREALPEPSRAAEPARVLPDGSSMIRRGLLYMLLAAVVGYFAGGYSGLKLPFPIQPYVTTYLSPLLFLGGFGLATYGFYLQHRATTHSAHHS
jgi:hypothetical protein